MAGHKGYAISFMMDILSGALTGSAVGTSVVGPYEPKGASGAGHLFIAIDVATLGDIAEYNLRVDTIVEEAKSTPLAQGHDRIYHPGEIEDRTEAAALAAGGLTLPPATIADLVSLAEEAGVTTPEWASTAPAEAPA